jgi:RNA polymerase sigma factor (sigma-70 family)
LENQRAQQRRAGWLEIHILPHEQWLRSLLPAYCSACDVDDIVQDCFTKILATPAIEEVTSPRGFLMRIARNLLIDRHRRRARKPQDDIGAALEVPSHCCPQDEAFDSRRALERVSSALDELPPRRRDIIERRRFAGQSNKAIAVDLGLSESAIEKNLRIGLETLRYARDHAGDEYSGS